MPSELEMIKDYLKHTEFHANTWAPHSRVEPDIAYNIWAVALYDTGIF